MLFVQSFICDAQKIVSMNYNTDLLSKSSTKHACILYGATKGLDRFGNKTGAIYFDGIDDYAKIETGSNINLVNKDYSISLWVREIKRNTIGDAAIFSQRKGQGRLGHILTSIGNHPSLEEGTVYYTVSGGTDSRIHAPKFELDKWTHVVYTFNIATSTGSIYVNGKLASKSNVDSPLSTSYSIYLGKDSLANGYYFNGALDDLNIYEKELTSIEVSSLYYNVEMDLIAYYPFDNDVKDYSGNNHHGVNNSVVFMEDKGGNMNSVAYFDGVKSFVSIADSMDLRLSKTDFTISCWVNEKTSSTTYNGSLVSKRGTGNDNGYILSVGGIDHPYKGSYNFSVSAGADPIIFSNTLKSKGWHHVILTYEYKVNKATFFIDGKETSTSYNFRSPTNANYSNLFIGKDGALNSYYFNGAIDELKIFGRKLDISEIVNKDLPIVITENEDKNIEIKTIFPNPVDQYIYTSFGIEDDNFQVIDMQGKIIMNEKMTDKIEVKNLVKGLYYLIIKNSKGNNLQKFKFYKE